MKDLEPIYSGQSGLVVNTGIPRAHKFRFAPHEEIDAKEVLRNRRRLDLGAKGAMPSGLLRKNSPLSNIIK